MNLVKDKIWKIDNVSKNRVVSQIGNQAHSQIWIEVETSIQIEIWKIRDSISIQVQNQIHQPNLANLLPISPLTLLENR